MSHSIQAADADRAPLMLWCSSHSTLAAEEIPLLLEAGFRVIPLLTDFWTFEYNPEIDQRICNAWKSTVGIPNEIVQKLQAIRFCANMGQDEIAEEELALLNEWVDVVYITVLPNLAMRLAPKYKGSVIFRPFGHGHLNNYTRIAEHLKGDLSTLPECHNFVWVPILTTLQEPEDPRLCMNANHLGAFVSENRLGPARWSAADSQPYVVETIPRIEKQPYYLDIYKQYKSDHGQLPLKILGGNSKGGGELNDPAIVGFLEDNDYYAAAAGARVSLYHGTSRHHVHYHPIEFMALGVPVLFHEQSAFAAEGQRYGMTRADLVAAGMYSSIAEANSMAQAALENPAVAQQWSHQQRFFIDEVFSRKKALDQARWIKRRVVQLRPWLEKIYHQRKTQSVASAANTSPGTITSEVVHHNLVPPAKTKRPMPERVLRELKRVWRKTVQINSQPSRTSDDLRDVPQQLQCITEHTRSQAQVIQEVSSRVGTACDHLQHMAVDVQVLAHRYDDLTERMADLQQASQSRSGSSSSGIAPAKSRKPELKFYGQFSPPVDRFIFERYFPDINIRGTFIECGAFDGQLECSCKFFEETMGWTGYNLEPAPHVFANLQRNRAHSRNYQVALSNRLGTAPFKLVNHPELGLNYGNSSLSHTDSHVQLLLDGGCTFSEIEVELLTYKVFVERENIQQVDLFVLDVEGHELDAIEGMQDAAVLPDVMCVEVGHTPLECVRAALSKLGYVYDISSHVNAFFVQQSKLPLFSFRRACK